MKVKEFLYNNFDILCVPSYSWILKLLRLVNPKSLNQCFIEWTKTLLPKSLENLTVSFDGKTIRSTGKMDGYDEALHIVSAHVAELGITIKKQLMEKAMKYLRHKNL